MLVIVRVIIRYNISEYNPQQDYRTVRSVSVINTNVAGCAGEGEGRQDIFTLSSSCERPDCCERGERREESHNSLTSQCDSLTI